MGQFDRPAVALRQFLGEIRGARAGLDRHAPGRPQTLHEPVDRLPRVARPGTPQVATGRVFHTDLNDRWVIVDADKHGYPAHNLLLLESVHSQYPGRGFRRGQQVFIPIY